MLLTFAPACGALQKRVSAPWFFCRNDASRALYHVFSHVKPPYLGTLYHVFTIRGDIEDGASSLVFLNRAALRDAIAHERFLMLFSQ